VNCNTFSVGFGGGTPATVINRPSGGKISFREANGQPDQMMTIASGGEVSIFGNIKAFDGFFANAVNVGTDRSSVGIPLCQALSPATG